MRIYCYSSPSSRNDLTNISEKYQYIPAGYKDIVELAAGVVFLWKEKGELRIWGAEEALAMNKAYSVDEYAPGTFAFADNGAGEVLLYGKGDSGIGVYIVETGSIMLDSDAEWIASDLNHIIVNAEGAERIFQSDLIEDANIAPPFFIESDLH